MDKLDALPEPNIFAFDSLRVKKLNRSTYVMNGELTVKKDLDDSLSFTIAGLNQAGGQFKKILDKKFPKFCEAVWDKGMVDIYNDILLSSTFPPFGTCPWKAVRYLIHL